MKIHYEDLKFPFIQSDLTNYCNFRCKFCLTDFSGSPSPQNMHPEVFRKSLQLLPMSDNNSFHVSCKFEPLIHPNCMELLKMIPKESRAKVLFTTNLSKELSDEDVHQLAKVNVDHINISLETFDSALLTHMTGVKKSFILENLDKISQIFPHYEKPPRLCFITMVLKDNYDEVFSLAQKVNDNYFPMFHVFRTPYNFGVKNDYNESNLLPRDVLDALEKKLTTTFPHAILEFWGDELSYFKEATHDTTNYFQFNEHYLITVDTDGTGELRADHTSFDLNQIQDIPEYFIKERTLLQQLQCKKTQRVEIPQPVKVAKNSPYMRLRKIYLYENRFLRLNAEVDKTIGNISDIHWDILINKNRYFYSTMPVESSDIRYFNMESLIDLKELGVSKINTLAVSIVAGTGEDARSHVLIKGVDKLLPVRTVLSKVKRRLK